MSRSSKEKTSVKVHFSKSVDSDVEQLHEVQNSDKKTFQKSYLQSNQKQNDEIQELNEQQIGKTLEKLINFIQFHNVDSYDVWGEKKEIKISQFVHFISSNYAYNFSKQEVSALSKITSKKHYLRIGDFQSFNIWKQQPKSITRLLSSCNLKKQKKHLPQRSQSPKETINAWFNNDESKVSSEYSEKPKKSKVNFSVKSRKNINQQSFEDAKRYSEDKLRLKVEELKNDIKQSVLEKKWDFIVMAGEMNQWIDQIKKQSQKQISHKEPQPILSFRYKIINKDPVEIIQQNTDFGTQQQIPHVVFVKKYQTLKKRMVKEENHKNNLKGTVLMVLQDNDKLNKNNLNNRINQRDQELNFVLLQIMRMKNVFQWQNSILKEARINS